MSWLSTNRETMKLMVGELKAEASKDLTKRIQDEILRERERCAKIAEHYRDDAPDQPGCCWKEIAQEIRNGI